MLDLANVFVLVLLASAAGMGVSAGLRKHAVRRQQDMP
jgi:hypothetical protein